MQLRSNRVNNCCNCTVWHMYAEHSHTQTLCHHGAHNSAWKHGPGYPIINGWPGGGGGAADRSVPEIQVLFVNAPRLAVGAQETSGQQQRQQVGSAHDTTTTQRHMRQQTANT
jgi:hypothetical protein